jgi:hypothetical protein
VVARLIEQIEPGRATLCGTILVNGPGSPRDTAPFTELARSYYTAPLACLARTVSTGALRRLGSLMVLWPPRVIWLARGDGNLFCSGSCDRLRLLCLERSLPEPARSIISGTLVVLG